MRRFTLLMISILGVLIAAVAATSVATAASTLPILLDKNGALVTAEKFSQALVEIVSRLSTLGQTNQVECKAFAAEGELKELEVAASLFGYLGPLHITFEKCVLLGTGGEACTGKETADASGIILALGEAHLVEDKLTSEGELGAALLFLFPTDVEFNCKVFGLNVPFKVLGSLLCLVHPLTLAKHFEVLCKRTELGDPEEVKYWNAKGEAQTASLGTSISGGAEEMSAEESIGLILSELEVKIDD